MQTEFKVKKNGFTLYLRGTRCEISNRYVVAELGDVEVPDGGITEKYAEKLLDSFIDRRSVKDADNFNEFVVKRVAFDPQSNKYIQLRAVMGGDKCWTVQMYDNELVYMNEIRIGRRCREEALDWMRTNFEVESCLTANVYRDGMGDCTNGGISANRRELYILSKTKGPFEPQDIRECVYIEWQESKGEEYIDCKPAYFPGRWYMAGGNFLYSTDSRFREITGSKYPIPIHDRREGGEQNEDSGLL